MLLGGGRLWPAIWAGSFAANVTVDGALFSSALIATGSTLQALVLAVLVRRHIGVPRRFERIEDVIKFVLLAALGSIIAPTFALIPLTLGYGMPPDELAGNWSTWWQGDACGVLVFAPLVLAWMTPGAQAWPARRLLEAP